ncbi:PH (Pleckstrin Homology) domain-containing protein [Stackebrandtia albiflava]|uniref:PH (Pleckstrin Homology) domain-containing protein n=1 Tax=Stackebrandtia albiflava TaxID=406432 RepID=A0A562V4J3_9ACTN|nr:PH domain-containing protein [Stackebrandtia albiflava]TWJ12752.1 PH (Pleckstrin Homology) domain-containing protein [Stackebrandtia albiflava]
MGFPQNLLSEDERVVLHMHPHWKELIGPAVWFVVVAVAGAVAFFVLPGTLGGWSGVGQVVVVAVAVVLLLWLSVLPWVDWATTHYVFTTHRLLLRTGVITRKGRDIPYARVNDVSFEQTVIQRMFRYGKLIVQSASEQGAVIFKDMPKVELVQSTLYRLVEEDRNRRATDDAGI